MLNSHSSFHGAALPAISAVDSSCITKKYGLNIFLGATPNHVWVSSWILLVGWDFSGQPVEN